MNSEIIKDKMINRVVAITTSDNEHVSGRVAAVHDDCIEIVFRNGVTGIIALANIAFIAPLSRQP